MKNRLTQIHSISLLTGILFLLISIPLKDETLDINIHSTYLVLGLFIMGAGFFLLYLLYALIYFLMRRRLSYILGLLHVIFSAALPAYTFLTCSGFMHSTPQRYYTNGNSSVFENTIFSDPATWALLLFSLGQVLFLINIVLSIIRKFLPKANN